MLEGWSVFGPNPGQVLCSMVFFFQFWFMANHFMSCVLWLVSVSCFVVSGPFPVSVLYLMLAFDSWPTGLMLFLIVDQPFYGSF